MTQCRCQNCFGLAVLTGVRLLVICEGLIWKVRDDIPLDRIGLIQRQTVFGVGTLTVHAAGAVLEFTGICGPGGTAVVAGLREHLAGKVLLERETRAGLLAPAAHFAPADTPLVPQVVTDLEFAAHT